MTMRIPTPLKFPGSKAWLVRKMLLLVPKDITDFVSPFFGSGVIELNIAQRGVRVYGYDICPRLTNFWQYWLRDTEKVFYEAKQLIFSNTKSELGEIKLNLAGTDIKAASEYYAVNRLGFSGKMYDGKHIKPYQIRGNQIFRDGSKTHIFPKHIKKALPKYKRLPVTVKKIDFSVSINRHPDAFIYCDPPYFNREKDLYNLDCFDHERLRRDLDDKPHWITSYQDVPEARDMYRDFKIITLKMKSTFRKEGKNPPKKELLIFSNDLAEKLQL